VSSVDVTPSEAFDEDRDQTELPLGGEEELLEAFGINVGIDRPLAAQGEGPG
jgi:hypothetical protein